MRLADKKSLTLELAKQIAEGAEKHAAANRWNMVIAIVDDGANLLYFSRMDDAQLGSIDVAQLKARTALRFKRPSKFFEDALAGGRMAVLSFPGIVPLQGGLPLTVDGKIVGAIGVSGGTAEQDTEVANAGLAAFV